MSKIIKEQIKISPSANRKIYFMFNDKTRIKIFDECSYYKKLYSAVDDKTLIEAIINKYVNMKLYNRKYLNNNKDVKEHKKRILEEFKFY